MGFRLEDSHNDEVNEAPVESAELAELEEKADHFEDCAIQETPEVQESESNANALKETEENYDDCAAKADALEQENPALAENPEDYDDCEKAPEGGYVVEVAYRTGGEISQDEAVEQIEDSWDNCESPTDMDRLSNDINLNEHIEVESAEIIEEPEIVENDAEDNAKEEYEQAKQELDESEQELAEQQEAARDYRDTLQNQIENQEQAEAAEPPAETPAEVPPETEEVPTEAEETQPEAEEVQPETEEVPTEAEEVPTETEEVPPEAEEVQPETEEVPPEAEEVQPEAEEVQPEAEEVPTETEETQPETEEVPPEAEEVPPETEEVPLEERIEKAVEGEEDCSPEEIKALQAELDRKLDDTQEEKRAAEEQLKGKFDNVLAQEKGTEEYKAALQDFNALQERKMQLDEQERGLQDQQDLLVARAHELRAAQLQKGTETMALSNATLAGAAILQERYDNAYYEAKPKPAELAAIREEGCTTIRALQEESDTLRHAMDAKMDALYEYVCAHNMDPHDTARDPHYQQMAAEYNELKNRREQVDYNLVALDENNIALSERLGEEYTPLWERPPQSPIAEVRKGTDRPGQTDYFLDEAKAAEMLSPFAQKNWEQMAPREQKEAVAKLADYNAEILGIEDKPSVLYYNKEVPDDYGGYSAAANAIYINEYSMGDAAETADTISHEYRHKHQHERAEKLENERDLTFKENLDDYIRPEDDYAAYKNQPVEADARAYARAVKDKIATYTETAPPHSEELPARPGAESAADPEPDSVFKKIEADDLPEDFEAKEAPRLREGLTAAELDKLRERCTPYYANGVQVAKHVPEFDNYKEHNDLAHGHIEKVRVKSGEACDAICTCLKQNDYGGLYAADVDRATLETMALYHDTGMDGNIDAAAYDSARGTYLADETAKAQYLRKALAEGEKSAVLRKSSFDRAAEEEKALAKFRASGFEAHFRKDHSLESAIHALRDRAAIEGCHVNADEVALGCLAHSKSNSGLTHLAEEEGWQTAINRLQSRVESYNQTHPEEPIFFDTSFLLDENGTFRQERLATLRSEALALRIGDADGHDTDSRTSQSGKEIAFSLQECPPAEELSPAVEQKIQNGACPPFFPEIQRADVRVGGVRLTNETDKDGFSRMFAVGEGNFKSLRCEAGAGGALRQTFELCDGDAFPLSTQYCVRERLAEFESGAPFRYTPVIKLGSDCSAAAYDSYRDFAYEIEAEYGVRMEIVR